MIDKIYKTLQNIDRLRLTNLFNFPEDIFTADVLHSIWFYDFKPVNDYESFENEKYVNAKGNLKYRNHGYIKKLIMLGMTVLIIIRRDRIELQQELPDGDIIDGKSYEFYDLTTFEKCLKDVFKNIQKIQKGESVK